MQLNAGKIRRERKFSIGNGALAVLVDSAANYWDRMIVEETVLVALEHFGMPYRLVDLAQGELSQEALADCAAIVIAQSRLGMSLSERDNQLIAEAVHDGAGLVNFDSDLRYYAPAYLEMFGFEGINPYPAASNVLRVRRDEHYITGLQSEGEFHDFNRMVTTVIVRTWRPDVKPLAEIVLGKEQLVYIRHLCPHSAFEPGNHAVLFAGRWGDGKAVQFTINPRVWRNAFFGHAQGMDDLFWRAITWAAVKPFAANMIPPFVTMSLDDCSGRHDFEYGDVAHNHGFVMMPSLMLNNIPQRLLPRIKSDMQAGKALYNSHALDYYELMGYHFGRGERTHDELETVFAFEDEWWRKVGVEQPVTVRHHWGEYGHRMLSFLKQRGRVFFCPALQVGLHKADQCMSDGYWPYNLQSSYYDYLPNDNAFFAFAAFGARHTEDVLTGCTALHRESQRNDVDKAAEQAARAMGAGLRCGFHGEFCSHEQKFEVLSLGEWDRILGRTSRLLAKYEPISVGHDEIAHYLKGQDGVHIADAGRRGDKIACQLAGRTDVPLRVSVFTDEGAQVRREYRSVESFSGQVNWD